MVINHENQPPSELNKIYSLLDQLHVVETQNPANDLVDQAITIINAEFELYKPALPDSDILVTFHRSLQYNDPRNLDLDLAFTSDREHTIRQAENFIRRFIVFHFEEIDNWPVCGGNRGHCDTDISSFSMEQLRENIEIIELKGEMPVDTFDITSLFVSFILTSGSLFPEQEELLVSFRNKMLESLVESPVTRNLVEIELRSTLDIRQERQRQ